ncbi:Disulfide isomerase [Rasamsonia emersonii CBS 393.64]|uniref:protein disulfide-isomerase n=1 Tax=Rasamsonia emersonii (strain ATCC 16479 / CBS 393.64 / IMI 116815) TaxID=1408163 RepID=A0A0F4Z5B1_RASE3|nr:Disulfide isomerase [Rasamsonia emersonii CBS 393.64]KKA25078.1 Disulfide isomerase [Rasamsonia emersonii CBS 393.64]
MHSNLALALLASLLGVLPTASANLYTKNSPVLQVDHKTYDSLIAKSNYTSIVEFYAPWCGHCQNLKPAYEKVAKNLEGLAKVAAVNCDDDANKPFCGQMGIQGFPTLKIVTPSKKPGKPRVEDYQGPRSAKAIVDAVVERIPNHVKRLTDKDFQAWLSEDDKPKAILFTEKGTTSALLRSLAIDFLGGIKFAQIRNKESGAVEKFGITSFPTLILLPGGEAEPVVYEGELKKKPMVEFLSQAAQPNPDPAPASTSKASKKSSTSSTSSVVRGNAKPTQSTEPIVDVPEDEKPAQVPVKAPELDQLPTYEALESTCLTSKSGTCVLVLLPATESPDADLPGPAKEALASSSELAHKLSQHRLPFYSVPAINTGSKTLRNQLGLSEETAVEIIALNGRRGWWRRVAKIEAWVDAIRLGEGHKNKLPEGVIVEEKDEAEKQEEEKQEEEKQEEEKQEEEEKKKEEVEHDEL